MPTIVSVLGVNGYLLVVAPLGEVYMTKDEFFRLSDDEKFEHLYEAGLLLARQAQTLNDHVQNLHERLRKIEISAASP